MGRYRKQRNGKKIPFVALQWAILNSRAYHDLSFSAAKLLPYFLGKVKQFPTHIEYCSTVYAFSYKEASRYGFATKTTARAINDLMEKGFIDPIRKGGLRGDGKSANQFQNSMRWQKYGEADFKKISWRQFV